MKGVSLGQNLFIIIRTGGGRIESNGSIDAAQQAELGREIRKTGNILFW